MVSFTVEPKLYVFLQEAPPELPYQVERFTQNCKEVNRTGFDVVGRAACQRAWLQTSDCQSILT